MTWCIDMQASCRIHPGSEAQWLAVAGYPSLLIWAMQRWEVVSHRPPTERPIYLPIPLFLLVQLRKPFLFSLSLHSFNSKRYPFSKLLVQYLSRWQQQFSSLSSHSLLTMKSWPPLPSPRTLLATAEVVTVAVLQRGVKPVVEGTPSSMIEMA